MREENKKYCGFHGHDRDSQLDAHSICFHWNGFASKTGSHHTLYIIQLH